MNWEKVESSVYPVLIDTTSSKVYNYMRRNVVEKQEEDMQGNIVTYYEYEEVKVLKEDWDLFMAIMDITPYTETKTAYYGESEKVFYNVPQGNITVFWDNYAGDYSVQRFDGGVTVSFDTLTVAEATISIMVQ